MAIIQGTILSHLEGPEGDGGRVPGGHKPHGTSHLGGLSVNPAGYSGSGEHINSSKSPLGPPTGSILSATPGEAGRRGMAGGDSREEDRVSRKVKESDGLGEKETVERQDWGDRGRLVAQKEVKALETAAGWKDRANTVWTDGSRLEGGGGADAERAPATTLGPNQQPESDEARTGLSTTLSLQAGSGRTNEGTFSSRKEQGGL